MLIDDIIVPRDFFTDRATYGAGTLPWDHHRVLFVFDANVNATNQSRALAAMAEIENACNIKFVEGTDPYGYLRIVDSTSNNSYVGKTGRTAQRVNIVSWSYRFIIVHELLHALGMWHEQQRPDRDQYVQINYANIQSGYESNFDIISGADTLGAYDFESLMEYDGCSFSTCCPAGSTCFCSSGCQTITALPAYQSFQNIMGQRSYISDGDIDWLVYVYGDPDCNGNGIPDYDDIQSGFSADCNDNGVPDECDIAVGVPTYSDSIYGFTGYDDCNGNGVVDSCELAAGTAFDCNENGVLDACDIASGTSQDVNGDGEPDECTPAPETFSLVSPANGSTGVSTGPTLDWTDSVNADGYLVEIDSGPAFSNPVVSEQVVASETTLPEGTLDGYTTYYWRIAAMNVGGSVVSTPSLAAFTTGAPPSTCQGDINGDGDTNVYDFSVFAANFGNTGLTPGTDGDFDFDGDVDVFDFSVIATHFGCPN